MTTSTPMHRNNRYIMYDQAGSLHPGCNARRSIRRIQQLRVLAQVAMFGLAILSYLAALSLITLV